MNNKIALVTGASSGIGESTAVALQKNGYTVYAAARRLERMEPLKKLGIIPLKLDVTDENSMQNVIQTIKQQSGVIDVLVNNAGYGSFGAFEDVPLEEARRQIEVNLFGLARLTQLVLPGMRQQHRGKIINITSIGGKIAMPFGGWYHASKFAIEGLSDSLRNEVKPFGIDVIIIEPGAIQTEWGDIAMQNMVKASSHSAYKEMAQKFLKSWSAREESNSEPAVISNLILKAVSSKNPKARYSAGNMSNILVIRKLVSDWMFDRLMMSQLS